MDVASLIPAPDAIPVAWVWFEGLNIFTFALHILMVNALVGGGALAAYLAIKDKGDPLVRTISAKLPTMFALAVNFGVAPLLFLQVLYGHFFYTSAILSAVWWLSVILLLIAGYYSFYIHQHRIKNLPAKAPVFLVLALVLALAVSLVLTSVLATMENPEMWGAYFDNPHGTILSFFEPTTVPRYLHFLMAGLAVGGLFTALAAERDKRLAPEAAGRAVDLGMKLFTTATMVQMAVGLWWLMALKRGVMLRFMGDDPLATALLLVSVALTIPLLMAGFAGKPKAAAFWTCLTVLGMVGVRAMVRNLTLAPHFSPGQLQVTGEFSPLVLFLVTLALGLMVVAYMLRLAFRPGKEA